jgi:hypothetical protein
MADQVHTRTCTICQVPKPATTEFFHKKLAGLTTQCRSCRNAGRRADMCAKERAAALRRGARAANPERYRVKDNERYANDSLRIRMRAKAARQRDPAAEKRRQTASYQKHRATRIAAAMARNKANPEKTREYARRAHQRRRNDPGFRLSEAVSAHIWHCLRKQKSGQKWESIVGYSLAELMLHVERQFKRGMRWANYGTKWQIDHIRPVTSFILPQNIRECWALANLRPLERSANIRKSNKRLYLL